MWDVGCPYCESWAHDIHRSMMAHLPNRARGVVPAAQMAHLRNRGPGLVPAAHCSPCQRERADMFGSIRLNVYYVQFRLDIMYSSASPT